MDYLGPIARQIEETKQRLARLRNHVEELQAAHIDAGPKRFAADILEICSKIESSMMQDLLDLGDEPPDEELLAFCAPYHKALREIHQLAFSHLESPESPFYPFDLIHSMESELERLFPSFSLTLKPYEGNTYRIDAHRNLIGTFFSTTCPELYTAQEAKIQTPDHWHIFLFFPRAEASSLLLNTVMISHEILHLQDFIQDISANLFDQTEVKMDSPTVDEAVAEELARPVGPPESLVGQATMGDIFREQNVRSAIFSTCNEVIHQWVRELIADLLAVRLYGPAYFLASSTLSLSLGVLDQYSASHPSSRMRIQFMVQELENMGYLASEAGTGTVGEEIRFWSERVQAGCPAPGDRILKVAWLSVSQARTAIHDRVRLATGDNVYSVQRFVEEAVPLAERLQQGMPPSEIGLPCPDRPATNATVQGILNAGWLAYLEGLGPLAHLMRLDLRDGRTEVVDKLNQLMHKGLEILTYVDLSDES